MGTLVIPKGYRQALESPQAEHWRAAISKEINGLIALNAPLTPRRIGSHSTRTTHPHFLGSIQAIVDAVGLPVAIANPLRHETKGEMVTRHAGDPTFVAQAVRTVSCGKWKRDGRQCGRCVPCLIRRASLWESPPVWRR